MCFFKKIGILIYMMLMLGAGALFLIVSLNVLPQDQWMDLLSLASGSFSCQILLGIVGGIFVVIGIISPIRLAKKLEKSRTVSFQNPDGEVTVSLSAIEDYIRKIAKGISGIKDVRPHVSISKKGINVITAVSISAAANIPEVTEKIQMQVKNRVQGMLGVEENINVKLHISKIMSGAHRDEGAMDEDMTGAAQVPFREM
ncbi:MAG: alkaline shock response membrane anchor protein AmaP [Candidatus Omnitrophota bacterium]|nr:alkaline shock response membrane anchor protein AmaP [Candidatus Omnitrophota bacterium]